MRKEKFLPISKSEWTGEEPDFVLVTGDAYVDHPSFANALIGRYLQSLGYRVAIIAQPDYTDVEAFREFGRPRLAFLVSAGNMDSMVNLYTANKAKRGKDMYTPGGEIKRPKRATIVYSNMIRRAYGNVPIVIGGIEASLRRMAHYDYWDNSVRRSILDDSGADLLVYGMGEHPLKEIAEALDGGLSVEHITYVRGTAYMAQDTENIWEEKVELPSFSEVSSDKRAYAKAFAMAYEQGDYQTGKILTQDHGKRVLVVNPPAAPLSTEEMDAVYELPFTKKPHPSYKGHIGALDEVQFSLVSSRGCFGSCAYCAIFSHQGKYIQARSKESLVEEAKALTKMPEFKGNIHDVGGPTANFLKNPCKNRVLCTKKRCLAPTVCPNLSADHREYTDILRAIRGIEGVKKVFVRSGIRYDYLLADKRGGEFLRELARHHVSGQLKVAPEHISKRVLRVMGKPDFNLYEKFKRQFEAASAKMGKKQYVLPYLIASHPGCTLADAIELAEYLNKTGFIPKQVQDFYPTPGSVATTMYYTGLDPFTMEKVYVPKSREEREMQRALMQFNRPENYSKVKRALFKAGRQDLIGKGERCLIR